MKYQFASYKLFDIDFAIIALPPDDAVTTTPMLASALDVETQTIWRNFDRNPTLFNPVRCTSSTRNALHESIIGLVREHKDSFGVKRVRKDMVLWTETDMYVHCQLSRSPRAAQFILHNAQHLKEWRRANIPLGAPSQEQLKQLMAENEELRAALTALSTQFTELREQVQILSAPLQQQASAAGQTLSLHRHTKGVRNLPN
jgi:hypothetical protein